MTFALVAALALSFVSPASAAYSISCVQGEGCQAVCSGETEAAAALIMACDGMFCSSSYDYPNSQSCDMTDGVFTDCVLTGGIGDNASNYFPPSGNYARVGLFDGFNQLQASVSFVWLDYCEPPPVCGDGAIEGDEACDDENTTDGDGCSSACAVESGWTCVGEPSVCSEDSAGDEVMPVTDSSVRIVLGLVAAILVVVVVLCVIV